MTSENESMASAGGRRAGLCLGMSRNVSLWRNVSTNVWPKSRPGLSQRTDRGGIESGTGTRGSPRGDTPRRLSRRTSRSPPDSGARGSPYGCFRWVTPISRLHEPCDERSTSSRPTSCSSTDRVTFDTGRSRRSAGRSPWSTASARPARPETCSPGWRSAGSARPCSSPSSSRGEPAREHGEYAARTPPEPTGRQQRDVEATRRYRGHRLFARSTSG